MNRYHHHERFLLLVIIALLLQIFIQIQAIRRHHHGEPKAVAEMMLPHAAGNATQSVYNGIADGATMKYSDFIRKTGGRIGNLLSFANPSYITRNGDHFIISFPAAAVSTSPSGSLSVDSVVDFDLDPNSANIAMRNIHGVRVQLTGSPSMRLKEVTLTPGPNGTTQIDGSLEVAIFVPDIPFHKTMDGQGNIS